MKLIETYNLLDPTELETIYRDGWVLLTFAPIAFSTAGHAVQYAYYFTARVM